jgi:hypothetical protein
MTTRTAACERLDRLVGKLVPESSTNATAWRRNSCGYLLGGAMRFLLLGRMPS